MAIQQTLSLKFIALPSAWDAGKLELERFQDGVSYGEIIQDLDVALELASGMLLNSYSANLVHVTEKSTVKYPSGSTRGFERRTERGQGEGRRVSDVGHMLPYEKWDYNMDWTAMWLEEAVSEDLDSQMDNLVERVIDLFEQRIYDRLFNNAELTGEWYRLGTGISSPLCNGTDGSFDYIPPPRPERGGTFANTHSHFLRLDGITQANLETATEHLWEHGIDGPYDLLIAQADIAAWTNATNVTGYVERPDPAIMYGADTSLAKVESIYIGAVKTKYGVCRIVANGRIPTKYWAVVKNGGHNAPTNVMKVRVKKQQPLGPRLVVENVARWPLMGALAQFDFGVGIGERRFQAVCVENDTSGTYAKPTIG